MNEMINQNYDIVSAPIMTLALLPAPVTAMRNKILWALEKNNIEALRIPIDWNEVRPIFAKSLSLKVGPDPIDILKNQSFDGHGQEIMRLLRTVLAQPFVKILRGPVTLYEWPACARSPTDFNAPDDWRIRWQCVRFADLARSNKVGRPCIMRLGVASDGVWHYFWSED